MGIRFNILPAEETTPQGLAVYAANLLACGNNCISDPLFDLVAHVTAIQPHVSEGTRYRCVCLDEQDAKGFPVKSR
jgi:hypothetical protein